MDPDSAIRSYVEEKIDRLAKKYLQRPLEAQVILEAEKFRRTAEITLKAENSVLVGKEEQEDLRSAVDLVLDKLEIQAKKHREKYKNRKKSGLDEAHSFAVYRGRDEEGEQTGEPSIIRSDKFVPKPYSVEDALILLEGSRDDFMVFRDADSMGICVLYRRPDGNFGLIETGD